MIHLLASVLLVALCLRTLWFAAGRSRRQVLQIALAGLPDREKIFLILGSAMIVGCFFAGQSIGYAASSFFWSCRACSLWDAERRAMRPAIDIAR